MNGTGRLGCGIGLGLQLPTLAKGIEKTSFVFSLEESNYCNVFKGNSGNSQPFCSLRSLQNFSLSEWRSAYERNSSKIHQVLVGLRGCNRHSEESFGYLI